MVLPTATEVTPAGDMPQPDAPADQPGAAPVERRIDFQFTATTDEYFRIWAVNLVLTILTLGIYSAWAKIRKRRYFYGHTLLDGEGFEYRARPIAILKGRLIAGVLLGALIVGGRLVPELNLSRPGGKLVLFVLAMIAGPWLLVRSLRFNAANTAYRNIRLRFDATYRDCLENLWPSAFVGLTGIFYPYFKRRLLEFALDNHLYGKTRFSTLDFKKPFIHAYAVAYGLGMLWLFGVTFSVGAALAGKHVSKATLGLTLDVLIYGGFLLLFAYIRARTINAVWNSVRVGPVRFESTLRARDMIGLYVTNALAIIFTLGVATPWAVVRTLRYRAGHTAAIANGELDQFVAGEVDMVGAAGEEIGEMLDFDVAL